MTEQMHEPGWQAALMTAAYYHVLNGDDGFGRALATLYQTLGEIGDREPTPGEVELMQRFAAQWPLPQKYAVDDLWFSAMETWEPPVLAARKPDALPDPPTIFLDVVLEARRPIWLRFESARLSVDLQARGLTLEGGGWSNIFVPKPEPDQCFYDPTFMLRQELERWVDKVVNRIRQSILAQADEIERKAEASGMRRLPPRLRNREHLLQMALRLYLRAVKAKSWGTIAREAGPGRGSAGKPRRGGEESARKAVIGSVKRWAGP